MCRCSNMNWIWDNVSPKSLEDKMTVLCENQTGVKWTTTNDLWDTNVCLFNTLVKFRGSAWIWILFCYFHALDCCHAAGDVFLFLFSCTKNNFLSAFTKLLLLRSACQAVWVKKKVSAETLRCSCMVMGQDNNRPKFKLY